MRIFRTAAVVAILALFGLAAPTAASAASHVGPDRAGTAFTWGG